jgi:cell division protein FtsL
MKRKDLSEERALFRQALSEGLAMKYAYELAQCPEPIQYSAEHLCKMEAVIASHASSEKKVKIKHRIVVALVAAVLLLLTACAAYTYRREIKKLFVKIYETSIELFYEDEDMPDKMISEYYTLSYVPDGYELTEMVRLASVGSEMWSTVDGEYIALEQYIWDGASYTIDAEIGDSSIINYKNIEVYYRATLLHTYIWNDGTYSFMLTTSTMLADDEIELIIDGLIIAP